MCHLAGIIMDTGSMQLPVDRLCAKQVQVAHLIITQIYCTIIFPVSTVTASARIDAGDAGDFPGNANTIPGTGLFPCNVSLALVNFMSVLTMHLLAERQSSPALVLKYRYDWKSTPICVWNFLTLTPPPPGRELCTVREKLSGIEPWISITAPPPRSCKKKPSPALVFCKFEHWYRTAVVVGWSYLQNHH